MAIIRCPSCGAVHEVDVKLEHCFFCRKKLQEKKDDHS